MNLGALHIKKGENMLAFLVLSPLLHFPEWGGEGSKKKNKTLNY